MMAIQIYFDHYTLLRTVCYWSRVSYREKKRERESERAKYTIFTVISDGTLMKYLVCQVVAKKILARSWVLLVPL